MAPGTLEGAPAVAPLTTEFLQQALDKQSQQLISIWQASVAELKRDLQDLGSRMAHMETKMEELVDAHNTSARWIHTITAQLNQCEAKIMDLEDRSQRSNVQGISETLLPAHLLTYVNNFFKLLVPDVPTDILLLDRLHRVLKPQQISASLPREGLLKVHYFHVKDLIMKRSRIVKDLPAEYAFVQVFSDLSAATLRQRKAYQKVAETLHEHRILYRWGFPIHLIISRNGTTTVIHTVEEGMQLLHQWNLSPAGEASTPTLPRIVDKDWSLA
ncbi:Hypothetical predicted protein [Pelobates cultripes]|uniref:Uncharacterized protein n=1 Tax=Pelobates cultripes TaxID=61616 RepID=A0AAD1SYT8_PELCU|nr:Hypothetical predicted protein [Pelobates cultripes]